MAKAASLGLHSLIDPSAMPSEMYLRKARSSFRFARRTRAPRPLRQFAIVKADLAHAEIDRHHQRIGPDQLAQPGQAVAAFPLDLDDRLIRKLLPETIALLENLSLAAEIVVQRGLGDVQPDCDLRQRRPVIVVFQKKLSRHAQHGVLLLVTRAAPVFERHPWRDVICFRGCGRSARHGARFSPGLSR